MIKDELFEAGLARRRSMFGPGGADDQVNAVTELNDKLQDVVTRYCFGDIWQRPELDYAERSKITVAMLLALGKPQELRVHLRGALANGVSVAELREIVLHSFLYCGIPAANEGIRALTEITADGDGGE